MPHGFTLETIIGKDWRCSPVLGSYFKRVLGRSFHFNQAMRTFIHTAEGRTLGDACLVDQNSVRPGAPKAAIPEQLNTIATFAIIRKPRETKPLRRGGESGQAASRRMN